MKTVINQLIVAVANAFFIIPFKNFIDGKPFNHWQNDYLGILVLFILLSIVFQTIIDLIMLEKKKIKKGKYIWTGLLTFVLLIFSYSSYHYFSPDVPDTHIFSSFILDPKCKEILSSCKSDPDYRGIVDCCSFLDNPWLYSDITALFIYFLTFFAFNFSYFFFKCAILIKRSRIEIC